jgi:transketolase
MRKAFSEIIIKHFSMKKCYFLTGDLGFMALEQVKESFQDRFINCGVAEQNMIGVAAGLAKEGFDVYVYSIAPFCYARPFEQIRNDLVFTSLPVCIVGNGGGYAYGHMGPSHHALDDCAAMGSIGVKCLVPSFDDDIEPLILSPRTGPVYLRLGYDETPKGTIIPKYSQWRCVLIGDYGDLVALGPLAGLAWNALKEMPYEIRPSVWAVAELPIFDLPDEFAEKINQRKPLFIFEEHVKAGGLGMQIMYEIASNSLRPSKIIHRFAQRYPSGLYGSQTFHRKESGLDFDSIQQLCDGAK